MEEHWLYVEHREMLEKLRNWLYLYLMQISSSYDATLWRSTLHPKLEPLHPLDPIDLHVE